MRVAIMQPYFFPYIGYFQLISAVDKFVIYDDVNYMKKGWVNRNKILLNEKEHLISIPCKSVSQNKLINEIETLPEEKAFKKILKTIYMAYSKAPFFSEVFPLIRKVFGSSNQLLSELNFSSIQATCSYLELATSFYKSSEIICGSNNEDRADRLINITNKLGGSDYINPIGGKELYEKSYFKERNIDLHFITSNEFRYKQFSEESFIPWLSIIDVLMFNSKKEIKEMLNSYTLV